MPIQPNNIDIDILAQSERFDYALKLCQQSHDKPHDAGLHQHIRQWQQQSTAHLASWQQAAAAWQATAEIKPQFSQQRLFNRIIIAAQIKYENFNDAITQQPNRLALPVLACCALLCLVLFTPLFSFSPAPIPAPLPSVATQSTSYQTQWRDSKIIELQDGSVIHLNWNSKVSVNLSASQRHIVLHRGEAQFNVAPDKSRPFTVEARGVSATAVGTAFTVRSDPAQQTTILVSEGLVDVKSADSKPVRLQLNQKITANAHAIGKVKTADIEAAKAWQQGLLIFHERPLTEVLTELNRYTRFRIEAGLINEPKRPVSGTYLINRADDALALIALAFELKLEPLRNNTIVVNSSRAQRPY